jgi:hypothetical protein
LRLLLLLGEVYPTVLDDPTGFLCKVNYATFRVEEEQGFSVGDGDGGVSAFTAGSDFLADSADEDLENLLAY